MIREHDEILCVPLRHTYYELNSKKLPEKQSINIRQKSLESMTNVICHTDTCVWVSYKFLWSKKMFMVFDS